MIFAYLQQAFVNWNRDVNGWSEAMAEAWMKAAAVQVARMWTAE